MLNVGLCVPHGGTVAPALYRSLFMMQEALQNQGWQVHYIELEFADVAKARNLMVQQCLDLHLDRVHFVDDDVLLPDNAWMLYTHTAPIVAGMYVARQLPHTPQMYTKSTQPEHEGKYWPVLEWSQDLLEVDAVGAGCLLVDTGVFMALTKRWDDLRRQASMLLEAADPSMLEVLGLSMAMSPWFEFTDRRGEDFYFCERAKAAGYRIFVDTRVQCAHLGRMPLTVQYFEKLRDSGLLILPPEAKQ